LQQHEINLLVAAAPEPKQQQKMVKEGETHGEVVGHSCHAVCWLPYMPSGEAKAN
jgi:hypothetical protein